MRRNEVKPRYAVLKSFCAVICKFVDRRPAMHPVSIYDHPPSMNARPRISQPIINVIYVNEWLFVLFTSQVISNISKIIYFSAQIFAGREFDGTGRSTVYVERYGTEYAI